MHRWAQRIGILTLLLSLSGCMTSLQPGPAPPDTARLEDGDIVLIFGGGVESWLLALCMDPCSNPSPPLYCHAEALYEDRRGCLWLGGVSDGRVRARPFESALREFQDIAVFRADLPLERRRKAAEVIARWVNDPNINSAAFDYTAQDVPGRHSAFSCVGFINEAYREGEVPVPFQRQAWGPNPLRSYVEAVFGRSPEMVVSTSSIFRNPHYRQVLQWHNEQVDAEMVRVNETVARRCLLWHEQGWRLRASAGWQLDAVQAALPRTVGQVVRIRAQVKGLTGDVAGMWNRLRRRGKLEGLTNDQQQARLADICDYYRERCFERVDLAGESGARVSDSAGRPAQPGGRDGEPVCGRTAEDVEALHPVSVPAGL
jgi:hypothetical protein